MWRWEFLVAALLCTASCILGSLESAELALLIANESQPIASKRITPKSVFISPTHTSCADGYRLDDLGRCIKSISINSEAQWKFILQRLNHMQKQTANKPQQSTSSQSEPLRLPIPLSDPVATTTLGLSTSTDEITTTEGNKDDVTSTVIASTSTLDARYEEATETPLLIIVANTTEPTTEIFNSKGTDGSDGTSYFKTEPTTNPTEFSTITQTEYTEPLVVHIRPTKASPSIFPTSWSNVRFPSERPSYIRFPSTGENSPIWWPQSWEQRIWLPQRRGHREPRPSWIHQ